MKFLESLNLINTGSNGVRPLQEIDTVIVHHDGRLDFTPQDDLKVLNLLKSYTNFHIQKGWKRLAYHIVIDRAGNSWLCNSLSETTYHAGNLPVNKKSIGICLLGDFDRQIPTKEQFESLKVVLNYLATKRPDMPNLVQKSVKYHREVRLFGGTSCCGKWLIPFVEDYRRLNGDLPLPL